MNRKHDPTVQPKAAEPLDAPGTDWLPMERAAFYFIPEYTGRGQNWVDAVMQKVISYTAGIQGLQFVSYDDESLVFHAGALELTFSPDSGYFSLHVESPLNNMAWAFEPVFEEGGYLYCSPEELDRTYKAFHLKTEFSSDGEVLFKLARLLALTFDWLDLAITEGHAMVMARKGSPLAPFTRIQPDQWRYFRMAQSVDALAEGPRGERLFSVFIAPSPKRKVSKAVQTKVSSRTACQRWLEREMRGSPTIATSTKADLLAQAKKQWPDLSGRGFEDAWKSAIRVTNAISWVQPGPRPKSLR